MKKNVSKSDIKLEQITSNNKRNKMQTISSLFMLLTEYFFKSFSGPFFAFVFPLIFIALLG